MQIRFLENLFLCVALPAEIIFDIKLFVCLFQFHSSSVSPLRVASPVASCASSARSSAAGGGSVAAVSSTSRVTHETHESLECEIKRLRERLYTVETENAAMSAKLNQQQWEVDQRYHKIMVTSTLLFNHIFIILI